MMIVDTVMLFTQVVVQAWCIWSREDQSAASLPACYSSALGDAPAGFQPQVSDVRCYTELVEWTADHRRCCHQWLVHM